MPIPTCPICKQPLRPRNAIVWECARDHRFTIQAGGETDRQYVLIEDADVRTVWTGEERGNRAGQTWPVPTDTLFKAE